MILNLTQHQATPEQIAQGVIEPIVKRQITQLLLFEELPSSELIKHRVDEIVCIVCGSGYLGVTHALIGGAPFLMAPLEKALRRVGIIPLYAFSERVSEEVHQPDGTVTKTNVFKHVGWVEGGVA